MSTDIELICDGDGLAVLGDSRAVEHFLSTAGVPSEDLALQKTFGATLKAGSAATKAGAEVAANSGRWVKLTDESVHAMKIGQLMKGSSNGVSRAIATTAKGKATKILEFTNPGRVGSLLTNPAALAGAAGIMAQLAMQQSMEEITDYLAKIDAKVDDILRAQKDAAIAKMIGVGFIIDEAIEIREHTGRVSEVTWSKVQGASQTIATTQAYALRQLDALAAKLDQGQSVGDLATVSADAEETVKEWLAVLARCFQLQDGLAVLELDRVFDSAPEDLDQHREGLRAARAKRRQYIATTTHALLERIDAAARIANAKVLLHPMKSGSVVRSRNDVAAEILAFNKLLGIETIHDAIEARAWRSAVGEVRDKTVESGARGVDTVKSFSVNTYASANSTRKKFANEVVSRLSRRSDGQSHADDG